MTVWKRGTLSGAGIAAIALLVAGCASSASNTANLNVIGAPQQLQPVQNSTVQQGTLPAIGATGTPAPGLSGQPVLGGIPTNSQVAAANPGGSFVTLGAPNAGGFSAGPEGVWTVVAGGAQCQLNLPMTSKTGTSYYRASAPGCSVPSLAAVAGWQQVGSQLQLFDDNGNIAAFMAPSGGRYIGTISGGQAISMQR